MRFVSSCAILAAILSAQVRQIPSDFKPIFNGRNIDGWHISRTVHHGTTGSYTVDGEGVLVMKAQPFGQGGLLLSDKSYKDFELYLEANPDPGFNSGIFLRSTEGGSAYQLELVRPGNTGALLGEQMKLSTPTYIGERVDINTVWKDGEWNSMRVRMTGEAPHITLWINDVKMWEAQMPKNDQIASFYGGMIGLQLHWSATYSDAAQGSGSGAPWSRQRFRKIAIKELTDIRGSAAIAQEPTAQKPPATNRIGMEFVLIQPGTMTVGGFQPPYPKPPDARYTAEEYARIEQAAKADSTPGFPVTIARPYYIGKYEVTQAQWKSVMGTNPSIFQDPLVTDGADTHPVDNITWTDAQLFVKRLNAMEKTSAYRLPTEFEWEYAARAGADDDIPWSAIREQAIAGYNSYFNTHRVGERKPNAWGLYDTLGNVWEWVEDFYNGKIFADPTPPRSGTEHVLKGGGFAADVKNATYMTHAAGPGSRFDVGFRIVKDVK